MIRLILAGVVALAAPAGVPATGVASWYGHAYHGRITAAGAHRSEAVPRKLWRFDMNAFTAAHRTLPFGTMVRVKRGELQTEVMITDRGPEDPSREIDLSYAAAAELRMIRVGIADVSLEILK